MNNKSVFVAFVDKKTEEKYESLEMRDQQEQKLYKFIDRAIKDLKKDPTCGIKLPKKIWPKEYVKKYGITNLWKYDLANSWRLIYTIQADEVMIMNIILEWFDHKGYERRFKY